MTLEYSESELAKMQEEATEQIRNMRHKAKNGDVYENDNEKHTEKEKTDFSADKDRSILLPLLLLLMNEGSDRLLLLALMYIMS